VRLISAPLSFVGILLTLGMGLALSAKNDTPFTLSQLADSALVADSLADFETVNPLLHKKLRAACATLKRVELSVDDIDFTDMLKATTPEALDEERLDLGKVLRDLELVKTLFINELKAALIAAEVDDERILSLREPVTAYQRTQLQAAYDRNRNRLFRYEQKYGPHAPRLNIFEASISYGLQGVYPFGPNQSGPGPLEPVLRYSTTWVVAYNDSLNDIPSNLQFGALWQVGLRCYLFSAPDKRPSFSSFITPSYISAGLAVASAKRNWFLLANDESWDYGAFLDIGVMQAAVTFGDNTRIFVGRQFQVIPYLF